MPIAEATARTYVDLPPQAPEAEWNVAPRKLVAFHLGALTVYRSSNPKGYLMPDVGLFVQPGWHEGTLRPDSTTVEIGESGIVVRISAAEEAAQRIFPALQIGNISSFVVTDPSLDHSSGLFGSHGLLSSIVHPEFSATGRELPKDLIVGLLEDAPTLVMTNALMMPTADPVVEPLQELRADATVAEVATRIAGISNLSDGGLAQLFGVARETFQRWRTGELTKPTRANRRRLGLLLRLLEDLDRREVKVDEWLQNVTGIDDLTPYELLKRGRLDDVEYLAAELPTTPAPRTSAGADGMPVMRAADLPAFAPRRDEPSEDLVIDDDEGWVEIEAEAVEDDE